MKYPITIPSEKVWDFCRRHHIRKLALFGSVLREDFTPQSDIDVLVEFQPGHTPGLSFFTMQRELSEIFGRKADLNTAKDLSPYFREEVLREAEILHGEAWSKYPHPAHIGSYQGSHGNGAGPGSGGFA